MNKQQFKESFRNVSNVLPQEVKKIRAVNRDKNQYEQQSIEKAGYTEINRIGNKKAGYHTTWRHSLTSTILIFIERTDGLYYYGGIGKA